MKPRMLLVLVVLLALVAIPSVSGAKGPPGCLKGGQKFVGDVGMLAPAYEGIFASINWTYPSSACTGGVYYEEGDTSVQIWKFPDGTWAHYVYVFSTHDLSDRGAFCEWDAVTDEEPCGDVTNSNLKYWLIHFNSDSGKFKATPAGRGFY
jgi:hypothetical protein